MTIEGIKAIIISLLIILVFYSKFIIETGKFHYFERSIIGLIITFIIYNFIPNIKYLYKNFPGFKNDILSGLFLGVLIFCLYSLNYKVIDSKKININTDLSITIVNIDFKLKQSLKLFILFEFCFLLILLLQIPSKDE